MKIWKWGLLKRRVTGGWRCGERKASAFFFSEERASQKIDPWADSPPPSPISSSSCWRNRLQLFRLSFICLVCCEETTSEPGLFHPRTESSTLSTRGWKKSYWDFSPEVVRQEIVTDSLSGYVPVCNFNHNSLWASMSESLIIVMTPLQMCIVCVCVPLNRRIPTLKRRKNSNYGRNIRGK